MKNFVLGVIFTVAVFIVGALAYLLLGFAEVRGDVPGTQLESRLMTAAVHASVRRHAPELANPFPPSDETLVAGGKIFLNECAGCHGTPGKATDYSNKLYPPAPHNCRKWAPNIRKLRSSGSRNTAYDGPECLLTANGNRTRSFGRRRPL